MNAATSLLGSYEYTLEPSLPLLFDPIFKHLVELIRRVFSMFMQRHEPDSDHALIVEGTMDQISALSKEVIAKIDTSQEESCNDADKTRPPQNTEKRSLHLKTDCDTDEMRPPQNTAKPSVNPGRGRKRPCRVPVWYCVWLMQLVI